MNKEKLREFSTTKLALNHMLKEFLQVRKRPATQNNLVHTPCTHTNFFIKISWEKQMKETETDICTKKKMQPKHDNKNSYQTTREQKRKGRKRTTKTNTKQTRKWQQKHTYQ